MNDGTDHGPGVSESPTGALEAIRAELESKHLGIRFILDTCYSYADLRRLMANVQGMPNPLDDARERDASGRRPGHDWVWVRLRETGETAQMLWAEFLSAEEEGAVEYLPNIPEELREPEPARDHADEDLAPAAAPAPAPVFHLIDNRFVSVEPIERPADQERYLTPISGRYTGRAQFPKPWWTRIFHFVPIYIDPTVCRLRRVVVENCIHDPEGKPVGMIFSEGGEGGTSYCIGYYGAAWAIDGDRSPLNPGVGAVYVLPGEEVTLG